LRRYLQLYYTDFPLEQLLALVRLLWQLALAKDLDYTLQRRLFRTLVKLIRWGTAAAALAWHASTRPPL
jgi:hypothetical protein